MAAISVSGLPRRRRLVADPVAWHVRTTEVDGRRYGRLGSVSRLECNAWRRIDQRKLLPATGTGERAEVVPGLVDVSVVTADAAVLLSNFVGRSRVSTVRACIAVDVVVAGAQRQVWGLVVDADRM